MNKPLQLEFDFMKDLPKSDLVDHVDWNTAFLIFLGAGLRYHLERQGRFG